MIYRHPKQFVDFLSKTFNLLLITNTQSLLTYIFKIKKVFRAHVWLFVFVYRVLLLEAVYPMSSRNQDTGFSRSMECYQRLRSDVPTDILTVPHSSSSSSSTDYSFTKPFFGYFFLCLFQHYGLWIRYCLKLDRCNFIFVIGVVT